MDGINKMIQNKQIGVFPWNLLILSHFWHVLVYIRDVYGCVCQQKTVDHDKFIIVKKLIQF